jgi:hypothetical protein
VSTFGISFPHRNNAKLFHVLELSRSMILTDERLSAKWPTMLNTNKLCRQLCFVLLFPIDDKIKYSGFLEYQIA